MRERNGTDLDGKGGDEEAGGAEEERGNCNRVILSKRKNYFQSKGQTLKKFHIMMKMTLKKNDLQGSPIPNQSHPGPSTPNKHCPLEIHSQPPFLCT